MSENIESAFREEMLDLYGRTRSECPSYNPTRFKQMVDKDGGVETARRLLHSPKYPEGLTKLWELGSLDLSVEDLVLKDPCNNLFTEQELRTARECLKAFGSLELGSRRAKSECLTQT